MATSDSRLARVRPARPRSLGYVWIRVDIMGWSWLIGAVMVVVAVILTLRLLSGRTYHPAAVPVPAAVGGPTSRQMLDERYAKGDLTTEENFEHTKHLGLA